MKVSSPASCGVFSGGVKFMWLRLLAGPHQSDDTSLAVGVSAAATTVQCGASADPPSPSSRHSVPSRSDRNWIIAGVTSTISLHLLSADVLRVLVRSKSLSLKVV